MILKCKSCIESWIFPTFFDWLLFIPGPRPLSMSSHDCIFCLWKGQLMSYSLIAYFPRIDDTFAFSIFLMMVKQMEQVACLYKFHSLFVNMSILSMKWYEFINTFYCLFIPKLTGHTKHVLKMTVYLNTKLKYPVINCTKNN